MTNMYRIENRSLKRRYQESEEHLSCFPESVREKSELYLYEKGESILKQTTDQDALFFLVKGHCKVSSILPNGKTAIVNTLYAPSLIGEIELFDEGVRFAVDALEDCHVLLFRKSEVSGILLKDTGFLTYLCKSMIAKEQNEVRKLIATFGYPLEVRLARFILDYREEDLFRVRKVTMADSLGVSYRHLQSVLKSFIDKGYLAKEGFTYHIRNEKALRDLSGELL